MKPARLLTITFYILLIPGLAQAAGQDDQFLDALIGQWIGRADLTPIGPRDYDIAFRRKANGKVAGSTGESTIHYWTFYRQDGRLTIRFLSTFAGNREPIMLFEESRDADGILFRASDPAFLSVKVSLTAERLSIDVFHWDTPHVSIRLARTEDEN